MRIIKSFDEVIQSHVDWHIEQCLLREKRGFLVNEIDLPTEFAMKVIQRINDELGLGGKLPNWRFGTFKSGEFEGKMAQTYVKDTVEYKKYFLRCTL